MDALQPLRLRGFRGCGGEKSDVGPWRRRGGMVRRLKMVGTIVGFGSKALELRWSCLISAWLLGLGAWKKGGLVRCVGANCLGRAGALRLGVVACAGA